MDKIPSLAELDSSASNYVQELDEGVKTIRGLYGQQNAMYSRLTEESHDRLLASLRGIEGLLVEEIPELSMSTTLGEKSIHSVSGRGILIGSNDTLVARAADDVIRDQRRRYEDELRGVDDYFTSLDRAREDFESGILTLTKITPLNETTPGLDGLHFYILRGDTVYEAHANLKDNSFVGPDQSSSLNPTYFVDPEFLEGFRSKSKGINGNAFLIANPSNEIDEFFLLRQGVLHYRSILLEYDRERRENESSNPIEGILGRIKRFMN